MIYNEIIECVDKYKYLGIILDEHCLFKTLLTILACKQISLHQMCQFFKTQFQFSSVAYYTKFAKLKGLGFFIFIILYHSGVRVQAYGDIKTLDKLTIQNRAIRLYLEVYKFASNLLINGDVGWISCNLRRKSDMLYYQNNLVHMDSERLTEKVFIGILIGKEHLEVGIVMHKLWCLIIER